MWLSSGFNLKKLMGIWTCFIELANFYVLFGVIMLNGALYHGNFPINSFQMVSDTLREY